MKIDFECVLNTCGDSYWSNRACAVHVIKLAVPYVNDKEDFGELRVYFDTASWDTGKDGLIYTDSQFLIELKQRLTVCGFDATEVDYSEQGMQGNNYVSLDVDDKFIASWNSYVGTTA